MPPKPQLNSLTFWLLGALFAIIMLLAPALAGLTYRVLADDISENKSAIQQLAEAVNEIKKQGAVSEALQKQSTEAIQQNNNVLGEILNELRKPPKPAS